MSDIRLRNLRYRYPGAEQWTLSGISAEITAGAFALLLGPSGSGKSTLAKCFNGLIPHSLRGELEGRIAVCGRDVAGASQADLAKRVGLVFQNPDSQFVTSTVETEIAFGLENLCLPPRDISRRISEALDDVGLSGLEGRRIDSLSGGEKQRLAIACQLAMDPDVLVLDEPTANLDPQGTRSVYGLLRELARDESRTLVLIEHQCEALVDSVDRVLVLDQNGCLFLDGTPETVFAQNARRLLHEGIWMPEVTRLACKLRSRGAWPPSEPLPVTVAEAVDTFRELANSRESDRSSAEPRSDGTVDRPSGTDGQETGDEATSPPAIDVRGLDATYNGSDLPERALKNVDLTVPRGSFLAVVGPNGAGKSTLAKHCVGVSAPPPETVYVDGHDVTALAPSEISHRVGYVFQNPEYQFIADCVWDELAFGLEQRDLDADEIERRVEAALERFDLTAHADANPFTLSHGEKRRLSVATMLVVGQDVLIVDEPTYGQDRANADALVETLSELHDSGRTIVMLTHDMRIVGEYADSVAVLIDGEIQFQGPPSALFEDPETLSDACLARPPLAALADRIPGWSGVATADCWAERWDSRVETASRRSDIASSRPEEGE